MKGLRRSLGKDKDKNYNGFHDSPASPSLPGSFKGAPSSTLPPNLSSKQPPKKIIRAIHSYRSRAPQELSFQKGDFFHVVGERTGISETDESWYDASNPATGARGLVPKSFFEELGKTSNNRKSEGAKSNSSKGSSPVLPSSSFMPQFNSPAPSPLTSNFSVANGVPLNGGMTGAAGFKQPQMPQLGPKAQSLYGRVLYDFEAERPDELDAKKGEHIIVIAQSNHEWFVAKPIGRLGGPGLIPASFVEIMNMATGKAIDADTVTEMVRGGALPPVEEWKKTTAEYKSASIPLGRFDFAGAGVPQNANGAQSNGTAHARSPSGVTRQANSSYESNSRLDSYHASQASVSSPALGQQPSPTAYEPQNGDDMFATDPEQLVAKYGILQKASVESFHHEDGSFWFHMRCNFTSEYSLVLYRLYEDFYEFQMALKDAFKVEAGRQVGPDSRPGEKPRRILPMMPGPTAEVNEVICADRVVDLTVYLGELCKLPEYIRRHPLFFDFLLPRPGDVEINPPLTDFQQTVQAESEIMGYLDSMPGSTVVSPNDLDRGMERMRLSTPSQSASRPDSRQSERSAKSRTSYRSNTASYAQPSLPTNFNPPRSSYTSTHNEGFTSAVQPKASQPSFVKIKIFHRNTDDLIAIRVPPNVSLSALLDKTRERLGGDVSRLCYRDDTNRTSSGQARLQELYGDEELDQWLISGAKMVLYAE